MSEITIQSLCNMTLCILKQSNLPQIYWSDAIRDLKHCIPVSCNTTIYDPNFLAKSHDRALEGIILAKSTDSIAGNTVYLT
jgi:hypothetical protein